MRGLSLVGLLIVALIVAYLWATHTAVVSKSGSVAKEQVTQLSGHDANGKSALESVTTLPENDGAGRFKSLIVTGVTPDGAMEKFYGFKTGDHIITEGQFDVTINNDAGVASAMLLDAFEKFQPVVVMREGQQVTLPLEGAAGKTAMDQFNKLQHLGEK